MGKPKRKPDKVKSKKKRTSRIKEQPYNASSIRAAVEEVVSGGSTVYKAAKKYDIPWSTLKAYYKRYQHDPTSTSQLKRGKPFVLPSDIEIELLNYINKMQEMGFGLTVMQIRIVAYRLAEKANIRHPFSKEKQYAGWYWWASFKQRYNLSLRVPESLSMNRAQSATREALQEFYQMLEALYENLAIKDKPERIWNLDESGFMFVMRSGKIVSITGKKYVYKQTFGEKGTTTTVLPCVNVAGDSIPPMIIFKGKRWDDRLKSCDFSCLIKLSEKGWINNDLFLEFFKHFVESIPLARPVVLFMDSHKSHLAPEVLQIASNEQIHIVTYPPHLTHLLQPLDVGVFRPLKQKWRNELDQFQIQNPGEKPTRYNFLTMFAKAYTASLDSRSIIQNAFRKAGIFPIDCNMIPDNAVAPSLVFTPNNEIENLNTTEDRTVQPCDAQKENLEPLPVPGPSGLSDILKIPTMKKQKNKQTGKNTSDKKKGKIYEPKPKSSIEKEDVLQTNQINVNICGTCKRDYSSDVKAKNGAEWIECQFCKTWYHVKCQKVLNSAFFLCSNCELSD